MPTTTAARWHQPASAESLQAGDRAVPRHRRPLEHGPLRQGIRRVRRPARQGEMGPAARPGAAKDLRSPPHPQRSDVHRRLSDARFLPPAQAVFVRLQRQSNDYEIDSREFPKIKQQLLYNLTNHGRPFIYVVDGNYKNRGELFLKHKFKGSSSSSITRTTRWPTSSGSGRGPCTSKRSSTTNRRFCRSTARSTNRNRNKPSIWTIE